MTPATRTLAWLRQFAKLWGFALFCVLIVYLFREVALPFIFAILVAYILAPVVGRFERLRVGGKPFPRAAAVIILYVNIIAVLSVFIGYFVPKLSGDFARMFREARSYSRRSTGSGCRGPVPGSTSTSDPRRRLTARRPVRTPSRRPVRRFRRRPRSRMRSCWSRRPTAGTSWTCRR